tara:strand:- start:138 stop:329 length:192 start_codon:yes stop_codon:yes gene_type:complete
MWIIANDCDVDEGQKVIMFIEDDSNEDSIIEELDKRFWDLFEYDPEGYDWEILDENQIYLEGK